MTSRAPVSRNRSRLDDALVARGLVESRSRARALILAGDVVVNGHEVIKAGAQVHGDDTVTIKTPPQFVSRGGDKLARALDAFQLDVRGLVAADFGASTGGFTDCLLQRGAARVYAIDVGYGQLAERVRTDPRVVVMDRVNAREVTSLPEPIDLVTIDVSFIGLRLVLPAAKRLLAVGGDIVALVKPQFEAGRGEVGKGGVVRDPATHRRVLAEVMATANALDLGVRGLIQSPLRGPAGNIEFFIHLTPGASTVSKALAIEAAMIGSGSA